MKKFILLFFCCLLTAASYAQQRVVIGLTGDITLGSKDKTIKPIDLESLLNDASPILQDADLTIGNLDGSLINELSKNKKGTKTNTEYLMPTSYARILKRSGYDVLTVANNHSMEFGEEGRKSTIKTLQEAGIIFAGFDKGYEYASINRNGLSIAICAFGHGKNVPSINDISKATALIKELKKKYDIIIVSFHNERSPRDRRVDTEKFAHACIDAGASLIFGHGLRMPRAMELYNNHLIAYGLGNFLTPNRNYANRNASYAPLIKVELGRNGELLSGKIYSFIQKSNKGPKEDNTNAVAKEIRRISKSNFPKDELVIQNEGWFTKEITKTVVIPTKSGNKVTTVIDNNLADYNPLNALISYSKKLLGCRYGRGHSGNGVYDCSGFTKAIYAKIGYKLNPSSRAQYTQGRPIDLDNLRPGDLVFWRGSRKGRSIGHVGMVVEVTGKKSFKFIHAATESRGVVIDNFPDRFYFSSRYAGARRILP